MQLCTDVQIPQLTLGDIASLYDDITGSNVNLGSTASQWGIQSLTFTLADLYLFSVVTLSHFYLALVHSITFNAHQVSAWTLQLISSEYGIMLIVPNNLD